MTEQDRRLAFTELPLLEGSDIRVAWDSGDDLGRAALLTDARVVDAARLVSSGRRINLGMPAHLPDPPLLRREAFNRTVFEKSPGMILDERIDNFYPQGGSQWDALAHYAAAPDVFYLHHTTDEVRNGALGIQNLAQHGIVGRGVLLDVAEYARRTGSPFGPDEFYAIGPELLDAVASDAALDLKDGDIVCVRTGWVGWYQGLDPSARADLAARSADYSWASPGLAPAKGIAQWAWDRGIAALAVDNCAVEPAPLPKSESGVLAFSELCHVRVLAALGIPLGELWDLDELALACRERESWEFLLVSVPLWIAGGTGAPANAVAIL